MVEPAPKLSGILRSAGCASPGQRDVLRAWRVSLVVRQRGNKHLDILPYVPFGGAKSSGIGRELGEEGLAEFTQLQVINIAV
jgi:acyl-CoA reductase-like NAD-dependent aldehyde dehydrogenase